MADSEFQADFETGSERKDGTSTDRRPDAVSLDYLRAFTLGPVALQNPDDGVFDYAWYIRVDNSVGEAYIARENDAGDDWQAESLLFSFDETVAEISECDLAFDQNGNTVFVAERPTGSGGDPELWIRFFDPTLSTQDFSSYGPGRTPRALLDAPRQSQRSDVLVFYFNDTADELEYRVQNETYDTVHGTGLTGVSTLTAEELVKAVDSRLQVIYSDHDAASGTYTLDRLVSVLYPILAQIEAYQPTHQVLSVIFEKVITRLSNQSTEAYQPTHEVLSALLEDVTRILGDQPTEAYQPKHEVLAATLEDVTVVLSNQPTEAYQPTHEVIAATLEEVIIRLLDQPIEAFQPTHEVVSVNLQGPIPDPPVTSGLVLYTHSDSLSGSDGDPVSQWDDESGNANHLTAAAGEEPELVAGATLAGPPALGFREADQERMSFPSLGISGSQDREVFVVVRSRGTNDGNPIFSWNADQVSSSTFRWTMRLPGTSHPLHPRIEIQGDGHTFGTLPVSGGTFQVLSGRFAGSTMGDHTGRLDGDEEGASGSTNVDTQDEDRWVGWYAGTALWADLDIAAILVYNRALTATERQNVEDFLVSEFISTTDILAQAEALWDAHDLALNDGDPVPSWADENGNHDLAQGTGSQQPTYRASGLNGEPAVEFVAANDENLRNTDAGLVDILDDSFSGTVLAVVEPHSTGAFGCFVGWGNSGNADQLAQFHTTSSDTWEFIKKDGGSSSDVDSIAGGTVSAAPHIVAFRVDNADDEIQEDDVSVATGAVDRTTLTCDQFTLGLLDRGPGGFASEFDGDIGAVAVFDEYLTDQQISDAYDALASRFGL